MPARRAVPIRRVAAALLVVAALAARGSADAAGRTYQVSDDDAARVALTEYRNHAEASAKDPKEWFAAILSLQRLLDLPPQRDVVVEIPQSSPRRDRATGTTRSRPAFLARYSASSAAPSNSSSWSNDESM